MLLQTVLTPEMSNKEPKKSKEEGSHFLASRKKKSKEEEGSHYLVSEKNYLK